MNDPLDALTCLAALDAATREAIKAAARTDAARAPALTIEQADRLRVLLRSARTDSDRAA